MKPAIVVLGYERPEALRRLLKSLANAFYPPEQEVPLVISLDRSQRAQGRETIDVARLFEWGRGPKTVIEREEHLGVVRHFRAAGQLSREYGAVTILEDDLTVAPPFYDYALQVIDAYGSDGRIGGFCLYGLWFNGFTLEPFTPIEDGGDVFFLGVPHTQGLCFTAAQWAEFDAWWQHTAVRPHAGLHPAFLGFGEDEWFPALASYLAETGRSFCFPRVSLTAGWGDAGTHFSASTNWFQTPIQLGRRRYALPGLGNALAVYDGFYELLPDRLKHLAPDLGDIEFDVDLNATKQRENLRSPHVLTSRSVRSAVQGFGLVMDPPELNVISAVSGNELALARREDVLWDAWSEAEARGRLREHAWRHHRPSRRRSLRFALARVVGRLRRLRGR